jgi:hypothetical protein
MQDPFKEKEDVYFVFTVATEKGTTLGGFGHLINKIVGAKIKLRGLSAFVLGRRTKVFCVAEDAEMFRAFAKKRRLRVREKNVLIGTGDNWAVLGTFNKWAISGDILPAVNLSSQEVFIYRE